MEPLERAGLLGDLTGLLRDAAAGHGRLVLLGGEAGVGKTAVVRSFAAAAPGLDRGLRVVVGACDSLSTPRPLAPLTDIAHLLGGEVRRVLEADGRRGDVFAAVLAALGTGNPPALVVFEDVHWADEATLDLLKFLGRRIGSTRALLVATYRDDEIGPTHPLRVTLGTLATSADVRRMGVSPLSAGAVRELAAGSGLDAAALHRQTGGNPFFVTEVLASGGGIPATVRDAVLARVAPLSAPARAALDAAAVIGSPVDPALLEQVAAPALDAIDECLTVGVLRAEGPALAFRHELAREAVLDAISPPRRAALHARVVAALAAAPIERRDPARLAHHAEAAGDGPAVLRYAPIAARQATALRANREAVAQYARALRFGGDLPDEERLALLEAYAEVSDLADQGPAGIGPRQEMIELARRTGDRLKEAEHLGWLAITLDTVEHSTAAERLVSTALAALEGAPEGPAHARVYHQVAEFWKSRRALAEAVVWSERAISLAERIGDGQTLILGLNTLGGTRLVGGDVERGRADLERSLRLAREDGDDGLVAHALADLGSGHCESFRFVEADRYLTETIAYATEHDLPGRWHDWAVAWLALTRLFQGRWTEATHLAATILRVPTAATRAADTPAPGAVLASFEPPLYLRIQALIALGRVRSRRGDPEVAAILDEALALSPQHGPLQFVGSIHAARAEAAWLAGDRERTRVEARAVFDLVVRQGLRWSIGEVAYWLWRTGDLVVPPPDAASPFALQIGGEWAAAAAHWRELGCPYEAARALAEGGDEPAVREALAEFERLGARPAAAAAARRLRELGAHDIPRGPRPATRANPAGLTAREVEVLRLIAAGLRNAEIAERLSLSSKTVDHHVSAALAKLGSRSRSEAVQAAARLGALDQNGEPPPPR